MERVRAYVYQIAEESVAYYPRNAATGIAYDNNYDLIVGLRFKKERPVLRFATALRKLKSNLSFLGLELQIQALEKVDSEDWRCRHLSTYERKNGHTGFRTRGLPISFDS